MPDNSTLPATGEVIATDELSTINGGSAPTGLKVQRVKVGFGSPDDLRDVDASFPLPVDDAAVGGQADAAASTDTGTFSLVALVKRALQNWTTLLGRVPASTTTIPLDSGAGMPVRPVPADLWRVSFSETVASGLGTAEMTVMQTGPGMTVSQSNGNLVVAAGTTANSETLIRSVRTFRGAHLLRWAMQLSSRIANNNFSVELADLVGSGLSYTIFNPSLISVTIPGNPFTNANVGQALNVSQITGAAGIPGRWQIASVLGNDVQISVTGWPASGSGTLTLWGWNWHRVLYNGTTATNALYDAQRRGWSSNDTVVTINSTSLPGHVGTMQSIGHMAAMSDGLPATATSHQFTTRATRVANIPDDTTDLYLFIRVLNGTTAPASSTTMTVGLVSVEMTGRQKVYLSGADQSGAAFSSAVTLAGSTATVAVAGTAAHSSAASGNPVQVGGVVATAASILEVNGEACRLTMTNGSQLLVKPYGLPETDWQFPSPAGGIVNTTDVVARVAAGASLRIYVTAMTLSNNSATATEFVIKDGASTVIWRGHVPANAPNFPVSFPTPLRGSANTALNVACLTAGAAVYANLQGYIAS